VYDFKLKNLNAHEVNELLPPNLIMLGYRGSVAHGTHVMPDDPAGIDDKDLMGVFVAPLDHYIGFGMHDHHEKFIKEWDAVSYEVRKMFRLLLKCNPNVMSLLYLPENLFVYKSELAELLIKNRSIFVSKQAYHSFSGYAHSQLKRMISGDFAGYMGEKRKRLVEQFGFDCKNGAHLIRLLRMGIEFLTDGELHVVREDAKQLIDIKKGRWALEHIKEESDRLFKLAELAYVNSKLPDRPDYAAAEKLLMEIIMKFHQLNNTRFAK